MNILQISHDLNELSHTFHSMEVEVQKCASEAAKRGSDFVEQAIRSVAPMGKTGYLIKSISRFPENNKPLGKQVYQITFSRAYNNLLQKPIKKPGKFGGKNQKAYYPFSQEYGWIAGHARKHIPGKHFMRDTPMHLSARTENLVRNVFSQEMEKVFLNG